MLLIEQPSTAPPTQDPNVEAGVIKDARTRQRRQQSIALMLLSSAAVAALLLFSGGGAGGRAAPEDHAFTADRIHAAAISVSVPPGWQRVIEKGRYRDCSNPIIRLDLASYRLPTGFGKHEGAIVVPANGILLALTSAPVRSSGSPWQHWRLTNTELRPAPNVGPNHYGAEVTLRSTRAAGAAAWIGSIHPKPSVLAAASRILQSVRMNQTYGCQSRPPGRANVVPGHNGGMSAAGEERVSGGKRARTS